MKTILCLTNAKEVYHSIQTHLEKKFKVDHEVSPESALKRMKTKRYDILFTDLDCFSKSDRRHGYKQIFDAFWENHPPLEIVVMAPKDQIRETFKAIKAGASDYLTYPVVPDEVKYVINSIDETIRLQSELDYLRENFWQTDALKTIQTQNKKMKKVYANIRSVAPTRSTVLIYGETGTGKSVLAKLIHKHSNRRSDQFIVVHCGAIPDTLLESELFGHERGAFTGAIKRKLGKFEIANGGTIFLDEIGTITPSAQIKLLNVLQEGVFSRLGGEEMLHTDARIIAATNADLKQLANEGLFRKDLYYRLNVFPIETPPLRERIEDIPYLADVFLKRLGRSYPKEITKIHPSVLHAFDQYDWPGNIRELENLIERAFILESSSMLTPASFPRELFNDLVEAEPPEEDTTLTLAQTRQIEIEKTEKRYIEAVLAKHRGVISESAQTAGITTRQLSKLIKKYGVRKELYKSKTDLKSPF